MMFLSLRYEIRALRGEPGGGHPRSAADTRNPSSPRR